LLLSGCRSILHRFGWISHRLNDLRENIPLQTSEILEEVGTPRDEEFAQALRDIPKEKSRYAVPLFQCLVAAIRPLCLKELADLSAELDPNSDPHEDAVLSACPALIARNKDDPTIIHFSHKSVKEFLTSNRLRPSSIEISSRYRFSVKTAHATLARVCINVLLRFDETADKTHLRASSPLALYAAQYWVQHTQQGNAATENQGAMERLFDPSKSHLNAWIWMHDVDKGQSRTMKSIADRPSQRSATPLYYAALCGLTELVKNLANLHPEDLHDSHGYHGTPLHAASYKGHSNAVLALLDSDPKMLDKKVDNKTPLHAAYNGGQVSTMELLLERGADVDATDALDNTLLHCTSLDGRLDAVELLLKNEADVNAKNKNGWTPLHRASLRGQLEVAEHLLKVPVDVNAQNHKKNTPLHVASITGQLKIVELLLGHDVERGIKGEHEWTPLEAAKKNRHEKIVERLSRGSEIWGGSRLRRRFDRLRRYAHAGFM
jgi:ankyrin repeat protein